MLSENKCHLRKPSLCFLGHVITADGILPDQEHIDAVLKAPPLLDVAALRSFQGLVSWYSKFLPKFCNNCGPYVCMCMCIWTPAAQASFDEVKRPLVYSSAFALFDPSLRTVISTDASDYGLSAVFAQVQPDGTEKPVAFASRTLTVIEHKYSTVEGRHFTLRTDHKALTTLLTMKGISCAGIRIARWSSHLLCFEYDVIFHPGCQNYMTDCLSRLCLSMTADASLPVSDFDSSCFSCPKLLALRAQVENG